MKTVLKMEREVLYGRPHTTAQRIRSDQLTEVRFVGHRNVLLQSLAAISAKKQQIQEFTIVNQNGAPYGTRTRVSAVKGQRPRPLDEGRAFARRERRRLALYSGVLAM